MFALIFEGFCELSFFFENNRTNVSFFVVIVFMSSEQQQWSYKFSERVRDPKAEFEILNTLGKG